MDKKSETILRKLLKGWVNRYTPPASGRARLLLEAARAQRNKIEREVFLYRHQYNSYPSSYTSEWAQQLFSWINENSFQVGLKARLI